MEEQFEKLAGYPKLRTKMGTHYCPGCSHGIIHNLIADVLGELDIRDRTVGVGPVGCSGRIFRYLDIDVVSASHGRAPAVATGIKRELPDRLVFTYQGDGDLLAIGISEILHAAARGEKITVIFVNNAVYGMTGGQMAPTTISGQRTSTSHQGRNTIEMGFPIKGAELLSSFPGVSFITRVAVNHPGNVRKTRQKIRQAFLNQLFHRGLSLVEILGICPTNWGLNIEDSYKWLKENLIPYYPLGDIKTP